MKGTAKYIERPHKQMRMAEIKRKTAGKVNHAYIVSHELLPLEA